ncbi:undecaprenyl-phosphate glucose phosphotransferase [Pseudaeromonas pectinilytica]
MPPIKHGVLRSNASTIAVLQRFFDVALIAGSLIVLFQLNDQRWTMASWVCLLSTLVLFQLIAEGSDFYRSWRGIGVTREIKQAVIIWSASFSVSSLMGFYSDFLPSLDLQLQLKWYVSALILMSMVRLLLRSAIGYMRSKGYNQRMAAIVGLNPVAFHLAEQIQSSAWLGIKVLGFYDDLGEGHRMIGTEPLPVLGELEQLVNDARAGVLDRIYIALPMNQEKRIRYLISELSDTTCSVLLVPDVFTFNLLHSRALDVNGVPLISIFDTPMFGLNAIIKRIEDIVLASMITVLISPVLIIIAVAVKLTSPGPVVFKQRRYGIDGKSIEIWKFRSMSVMENGDKVVQATKGDSRLTCIGGFLRATSLDELPQFINVLKGDMSIVGPRPHAVAHNEEYRKLIKGYMLRHKVKPGITGWAQVNGWRGETDTLEKMERRVEFDLEYIRSWSLWLDLKIVFFTIFRGFINKNAY